MAYGIENHTATKAVPLKTAVLCIDCESVSASRCDECPVCGSHSIFSLARMLGGSLTADNVDCPAKADNIRFDLEITIGLEEMEAKDLNAAVQGITDLIGPKLGRGLASLHILVDPVLETCHSREAKAA